MARYEISTDNFTAAIAKLVAEFRKEDPSIGRFEAVCHDGTKVTIRMPSTQKNSRPTKGPIRG